MKTILKIIFFTIIFFLIVVVVIDLVNEYKIKNGNPITQINCIILGITAIAIFFYTFETYNLRKLDEEQILFNKQPNIKYEIKKDENTYNTLNFLVKNETNSKVSVLIRIQYNYNMRKKDEQTSTANEILNIKDFNGEKYWNFNYKDEIFRKKIGIYELMYNKINNSRVDEKYKEKFKEIFFKFKNGSYTHSEGYLIELYREYINNVYNINYEFNNVFLTIRVDIISISYIEIKKKYYCISYRPRIHFYNLLPGNLNSNLAEKEPCWEIKILPEWAKKELEKKIDIKKIKMM